MYKPKKNNNQQFKFQEDYIGNYIPQYLADFCKEACQSGSKSITNSYKKLSKIEERVVWP